jgi:hypothetical protein
MAGAHVRAAERIRAAARQAQARMCTCAAHTRSIVCTWYQRRGPCSLPYVGQQSHTRHYSCVTNACIRSPRVRARTRASERASERAVAVAVAHARTYTRAKRTESAANTLASPPERPSSRACACARAGARARPRVGLSKPHGQARRYLGRAFSSLLLHFALLVHLAIFARFARERNLGAQAVSCVSTPCG